jgi:hypothetical protein
LCHCRYDYVFTQSKAKWEKASPGISDRLNPTFELVISGVWVLHFFAHNSGTLTVFYCSKTHTTTFLIKVIIL